MYYWFQVESAKALRTLTDLVNKLLTDELFSEPLADIKKWIDQATVDTSPADVQAKIKETETIVGFT